MTTTERTVKSYEDVISRQALYDALYKTFHEEDAPNNITKVDLGLIRDFVKNFPSATLQQKVGHWTEVFDVFCECSECGCVEAEYSNYCPNCGIKMKKGVEK